MKEAQKPDTAAYRTLQRFLRAPPRRRSPAEYRSKRAGDAGRWRDQASLAPLENDKILQAKGHDYSLEALLLAGNYQMADLFRNGSFATTYLSPRDYHRVHMPCNGILQRNDLRSRGDLFSVNHLTAQNVPNLFARNERVICLL